MKGIRLSTTRNSEIIDITAKVEAIVADSGIKEGTSRQQPTVQSCCGRTCICLVFAPHATAAILILEADGAVEKDVLNSLFGIVPKNTRYAHQHGSDSSHGAAHVLSSILGTSKAVPVVGGRLQLGTSPATAGLCSRLMPTCTWQSIAFCELDGSRSDRKAVVQVVGK